MEEVKGGSVGRYFQYGVAGVLRLRFCPVLPQEYHRVSADLFRDVHVCVGHSCPNVTPLYRRREGRSNSDAGVWGVANKGRVNPDSRWGSIHAGLRNASVVVGDGLLGEGVEV